MVRWLEGIRIHKKATKAVTYAVAQTLNYGNITLKRLICLNYGNKFKATDLTQAP